MKAQIDNPTTDQHTAEESALDDAIKVKTAEIRALLPVLKRTVAAFGELHDPLDEDHQIAVFDAWCEREFGVIPRLLLIAMVFE